jgi:hypothetical protein
MSRQITTGFGNPAVAVLERRVAVLESTLAELIEAVALLARGLQEAPVGERDHAEVARQARLAHELLLTAGLDRRSRS